MLAVRKFPFHNSSRKWGYFFQYRKTNWKKKLSTNFFQKKVFEIDTCPGNLFVLKNLTCEGLEKKTKQAKLNQPQHLLSKIYSSKTIKGKSFNVSLSYIYSSIIVFQSRQSGRTASISCLLTWSLLLAPEANI